MSIHKLAIAFMTIGKYDPNKRAYIESHYESFVICGDPDIRSMSSEDRAIIIGNGLYLCSQNGEDLFWSDVDEREDFNPTLYDHDLNITREGSDE